MGRSTPVPVQRILAQWARIYRTLSLIRNVSDWNIKILVFPHGKIRKVAEALKDV